MAEDEKSAGKETSGELVNFGDVFTNRTTTTHFVITDLMESPDTVGANPILSEEEGKEVLGVGGSTGVEDIDEIIGHWELGKIKEAMSRFYGEKGKSFLDRVSGDLERSATVGSRLLFPAERK